MGMTTIGPLVLPNAVLLLLAALATALLVERLLRTAASPRLPDMLLLCSALLGARAAYVLMNLPAYRSQPWSVFNIRDGGWSWPAGLACAWLVTAWLLYRRPAQRRNLLVAMSAASLVWLSGVLLPANPDAGRPMHEQRFADVQGEAHQTASLLGKPTVVNLWASWCPPCQREMPAFAAVQAEHPDINMVFLNQGETPAAVQQFLDRLGQPLEHVWLDPASEWSRIYGSGALPTTLFFDARGKLAGVRMGELSRATLTDHILKLKQQSAP